MFHPPSCVARLLLFLAAVSFPGLPTSVAAEADEAKSRSKEELEATARLITAELPQWKLWKGANHARELKLEPKSVLRWTNPGIGRLYGDVYVWTADGRPEVVMSLYKAWEPEWGFAAEMHSLSVEAISAERDGELVWQPPEAGVELRDVPGAPEPAESAARRLQQMRGLANDFSATVTDERRKDSGERQELRLLTQPVYRYRSTRPEVIDGALFAIVLGTDPEVFLLLEARQIEDAAHWRFALARMNKDELQVRYKGKEIWRAERAAYPGKEQDRYRIMSIAEPR